MLTGAYYNRAVARRKLPFHLIECDPARKKVTGQKRANCCSQAITLRIQSELRHFAFCARNTEIEFDRLQRDRRTGQSRQGSRPNARQARLRSTALRHIHERIDVRFCLNFDSWRSIEGRTISDKIEAMTTRKTKHNTQGVRGGLLCR